MMYGFNSLNRLKLMIEMAFRAQVFFYVLGVLALHGFEVFATQSSAQTQLNCDAVTRFSSVSPHVIRAEYAPSFIFENRPSITFIERSPASAPSLSVLVNDSTWCNFTNGVITMSYSKQVTPLIQSLHTKHSKAGEDITNTENACTNVINKTDFVCNHKCERVPEYPQGIPNTTEEDCCAKCTSLTSCGSWAYATDEPTKRTCYLVTSTTVQGLKFSSSRNVGSKSTLPPPAPGPPTPPPPPGDTFFAHHLLQASGGSGATQWHWRAGMPSVGNLNGTVFPTPSTDLAGCCTNPNERIGDFDHKYPLDQGLLSREGWAVVDDSASPLIDNGTGFYDDGWISDQPRPAGNLDWYLFGCGNAYATCLAEFTQTAGPIALPPMSVLGVWWSRHWGEPFDQGLFGPMTEKNIMTEVVDGYVSRDLPLNVVVLDMEWHSMLDPATCKEFIGKKGWGGYTWNTTLFPDPEAFVASVSNTVNGSLGIKVALNYHPDEGIDRCQKNYAAMATALGVDPASGVELPDLNPMNTNRTYCDAYFEYMIEPTYAQYAWTDSPDVTTWSNALYVQYPAKKGKRGINFSRYGGLGNHRTAHGFSGDTLRKWDTLAYEIWMTPQASNIGFGWWSHDIGGFSGGVVDKENHTESPELFLRWLQFATWAPIFRTHCRYCEQRIWTFGSDWYPMMRATMLARNALVPYIYAHAALETHANGRSLLVPMYWDYADTDAAYEAIHQYLFGKDFIVAPISNMSTGADNTTTKSVWLPEHESWIEWSTGKVAATGVQQHVYTLGETPVWVRAGAFIPTQTMASCYQPYADPTVWIIAPGGTSGSASLYEDASDSMAYRSGEFATTTGTYHTMSARIDADAKGSAIGTSVMNVTIGAAAGQYAGMPTSRLHQVLLMAYDAVPTAAWCNGASVPETEPDTVPGRWRQEGMSATGSANGYVVACAPADVGHALSIRIDLP